MTMLTPVENTVTQTQVDANLKKAHEFIYSIDFSMIINKLVKRHKWLRIEAEEVCKKYRNFLWLLKKYEDQGPFPPSEEIDEFWHHHILDTQKYAADCEKIFGYFLNHYPYYGMDDKSTRGDLDNAFVNTQKFYNQEFGHAIESVQYRFKSLLRILMKFNLIKAPA